MVRTLVFVAAWLFVFLVAGYDVYFAWVNREGFHVWEMNPLARWAAELCGLGVVFGIKAALVVFAALVAAYCYRCRHRLLTPYTAFVSGVHLCLSIQYLIGHLRIG
jgi:hypothetical protein